MSTSNPPPARLYLHPMVMGLLITFCVVGLYFMWTNHRPSDQVINEADLPVETTKPESPEVFVEELSLPAPIPEAAPAPSRTDLLLSDSQRDIPGETPSEWLYYRSNDTELVEISGAWDGWSTRPEMRKVTRGVWAFHIGGVEAPFGSYEFKFVLDDIWEGGSNRILYLNEEGQMELPPQVVAQALIEHPHQIRVLLYDPPENPDTIKAEIKPSLGNLKLRWNVPENDPTLSGFQMEGKDLEFVFDPATYGMKASDIDAAQVAGNFNGWNPQDESTQLDQQADGTFTALVNYAFVDSKTTDTELLFKFVINGDWKSPPEAATNKMLEPGTPHMNLTLPRGGSARPELLIQTQDPIDLSTPPLLLLTGLHKETIKVVPSPGAILETLYSPKAMGVTLDREKNETVYRLFAPRATSVTLGLFDGPYYVTEEGVPVEPARTVEAVADAQGVWEHTEPGLTIGQYYAYQVSGPTGNGEGFNGKAWLGDPYAKAVALAEGNSIVMDMKAGTFKPLPKPRIAWEDMVIYETHIRHFTQDPSSGVDPELRGKYKGFLASEGTGTGIDHLKELGINVIQFLPIHEFNNGFADKHDWGYASCFFFSPESSYATKPLEGSQVEEFRELVDGLHDRGFAVFLDVVYNHIGGINVFNMIDRKYYFRLNPDHTNCNFSGCGNDVASERPMMRRLITESVLFWVEEYGIDGFRFDLAELIDDQTLLEIEREIREKHPHVVLHSEPWSFRGSHKDFLGPTTWGAWNDRFREPAKQFVVGDGGKDRLKQAIRGSVENWTRHPLQSVNYMESHDDNSLVDELTLNANMDGRDLSDRDERIHKLAATLIFSSLGAPMVTEGQAYLRSKHGIRNTYNKGDELNSLRWDERERDHAKEVLSYYQQIIHFRLSDLGRALRVKDAPSLEYTQFVETDSDNVLGWILNATQERPGIAMVMVLMNAGMEEVTVEVPLPEGYWRQIGDGDNIYPNGIPNFEVMTGMTSVSITVPPQTAFLYRSGM